MKYIHVKNLEKYHPGYTERNLIWCKIHFSMISGDPNFEMLDELDQWRFVKFIMLELQSRGPVPIDQKYLERKGFNFKKRSMLLTIQELQKFIEVRNAQDEGCVTQDGKCVATSISTSISSLKRNNIPKDQEEATEYFLSLGADDIAAQRFYDYFCSNGWMVSRHKMKDWKAAARNWVNRDKEKKQTSASKLKNRAKEIAKEIEHL